MNDALQIRALFHAFLARFFENEISENSRDTKASFLWILAILAVPGVLLPFANIFRWGMLLNLGVDVYQREIIADKVMYLSFGMGGVMLLTAVVWQALLIDRRDAIVLGSFPVRPRVIVAAKVAALLAYVGIIGGGMHVIAAAAYGVLLATSLAEVVLGIIGHFISGALASMFACVAVAALQAAILAVAGARWFARVTAPAQLVLAAAGLMLFLLCPMIGAATVDFVRGNDRSAWVLWMPPVWFLGIYEVVLRLDHRAMPDMAARAGYAWTIALGVLLAAYPFAYRRITAAAMYGSPLGTRRSRAGAALAWFVRTIPLPTDTRAALHFIVLTLARVARHKLIIATALGGALAVSLPFMLHWAGNIPAPVPTRSHIAVPFVFVMCGLAGLRMAYNVPADGTAAWIFSTAGRPARIGAGAARTTGLLAGAALPSLICLPGFVWAWGAGIGISMAMTIATFGALITEIGVRNVDFIPFSRSYNPQRAQLQTRWPLYLLLTVLFLQFLPWIVLFAVRAGNYWIVPVLLASATVVLRYLHPPEPPLLVDADLEDKPLALRLY